jgi:acyl-coenzyme A synthetase/AMP-(fatty) acid ligase
MSPNVTDAIFARGERDPRAVAIIDAGRTVDYQLLCRSVRLAAQRFREAGWKAGDIVGVSVRDSPALHLVASLGLARMGATQVSFPARDPLALHLSRIRHLGVSGLVADHEDIAGNVSVPVIAPDPAWLANAAGPAVVEDFRASGGDRPWLIVESSGTTGEPKLIVISHACEFERAGRMASIYAHLPGERFFNFTGLNFLIGISQACRCLSDGGTVAFPPAGLGADQLLDWIDLHQVNYVACVPLNLHGLLQAAPTGTPRLRNLRILRISTAPLHVSALDEVRRRISPNVYIGYGTTEAGMIAIATPAMLAAYPDTVGRLLDGIDLELVDAQDRPMPAGEIGRVRMHARFIRPTYVGGETPDQLEQFRDGWFYPGDMGVKNETGMLFLKGRADEVMNFQGVMINPSEIESVLRRHPAVVEVAAFSLPSREHQDVPAVAIVSGEPLQIGELHEFCVAQLGARAPVQFFRIDAIPRNSMGKILRHRLSELAMQTISQQQPR